MAESGIYEIVNLVNGKRYVGSAVRIEKRWYHHRRDLERGRHHSRYLQRSWNTHGSARFEFRVIEEVEDVDRLLEREQHYLDTLQPEYNTAPTAGSSRGIKWSEESRRRKSEQTKAYFDANPDARRRLSDALKGKPSPNKGIPLTNKQKARVSEVHRELWSDPDYRKRMSDVHKAYVFTDAHRAAISKGLEGTFTPEYLAKKSSSMKDRWKDPEYRARVTEAINDPEAKKKNARATEERWKDPEWRTRLCAKLKGRKAHNKGKPMSAEQKAKLAEAMRRKYAEDPEYRKKISERTKAAMADPTIREKCRSGNLGRIHSKEEREKRATSLRGKKRTPEQRAAMSARTKAFYARKREQEQSNEPSLFANRGEESR